MTDSYNQLPWKPVTSSEILAYLGILIYMGIHIKPHISNYWNTDKEASPVSDVIGLDWSWIRSSLQSSPEGKARGLLVLQ